MQQASQLIGDSKWRKQIFHGNQKLFKTAQVFESNP